MPSHRLLSSLLAVSLLPVVTFVTACGASKDTSPASAASAGTSPLKGEITVFAASSLTEALKEAGRAFQGTNADVRVNFNFAASSALAIQINEGAPADVFASADDTQMKAVTDTGNAAEPQVFATSLPVVVVPKGSTAVRTFADLAKPGLKLVLAASDVPIGHYSREILAKGSGSEGISSDFSDRVLANLKSNEPNARAVLAKVQLGEADAGIVYWTDVSAARDEVRVVDIPLPYNVTAEYSIAAIKWSGNSDLASAFVEYVLSSEGQSILQKHGFGSP